MSNPTVHPSEKAKRLYIKLLPMSPVATSQDRRLDHLMYVNDDEHPVLVNNEHFTGEAVFRCRDFSGWTPADPATGASRPPIRTTPYFDGHRRTFSLVVSGRFKRAWNADDIMFGTFFASEVVKPYGYRLALAFARKIDGSMLADLDVPEPYMCSPMICAMNFVNARLLAGREAGSRSQIKESRLLHKVPPTDPDPLWLPPWEFGGKAHVEENLMARHNLELKGHLSSARGFLHRASQSVVGGSDPGHEAPRTTTTERRSYFSRPENRRGFVFQPDVLYTTDFNSPYVDLNRMALRVGVSIDATRYLNGQPLRYQCRTRDGSIVFWTIEVGLV